LNNLFDKIKISRELYGESNEMYRMVWYTPKTIKGDVLHRAIRSQYFKKGNIMKLMNTKLFAILTLLSVTGYALAVTSIDTNIGQMSEVEKLNVKLVNDLIDIDTLSWKTGPVLSAIKALEEKKALLDNEAYTKVKDLLEKGSNREAMEALDKYLVRTEKKKAM